MASLCECHDYDIVPLMTGTPESDYAKIIAWELNDARDRPESTAINGEGPAGSDETMPETGDRLYLLAYCEAGVREAMNGYDERVVAKGHPIEPEFHKELIDRWTRMYADRIQLLYNEWPEFLPVDSVHHRLLGVTEYVRAAMAARTYDMERASDCLAQAIAAYLDSLEN